MLRGNKVVSIDTEKSCSRRKLLKLSALAGAILLPMPALLFPGTAQARIAPTEREKTLKLYNLHTGERLTATFWADGRYVPEQLKAVDRILRDHHANAVTDIDPRLVELVYRLQQKLETPRGIDVVCGYRSPATNARLLRQGQVHAKHSFHTTGQALDFRIPGRDLRHLRSVALSLRAGGVGYYPRAHFIHVDVGPVRHWG